jgi:MHS family proline/betaine transporter-like MFS transporter
MQTWGWRIPFLIAGVLGLIVTVMRRTMEDPPVYRDADGGAAADAGINMSNGTRTLRAIGLILPFTVGTYVFLNYLPTFINTQVKLPASEALWANTIAAIIAASSVPFLGALSDRIGRKPQLLMAGALFVVLPYPIFTLLLSGPGFWMVLGSQTALDLTHAMVGSLAAATLSELFPTRIRTTWMTTVYALTVTIFGGFAPFIVTYLISVTGKPIAPVFYIISAGIISLLIVSGYRETAFRRLE